jgi:hypothetical protein
MNSRITFELDFDSHEPYIRVISQDSEDLRDKVVSYFKERFGHTSSWCKVVFQPTSVAEYRADRTEFRIYAIPPDELKDESDAMVEQAQLNGKIPPQPSLQH